MRKIDRKLFLLFFGRGVQALLAVATIRLLTELLPKEQVGHQYLINSVILWFSLVLINPVGMFVNRHLHEWKESKSIYTFISQINKFFIFVAVVSVPIVFVLKNYFLIGDFVSDFELICFVGLYIYFSTWFQTQVSFFNLFDHQKQFVSLSILSQGSGLIFAIIAVKFFRADALSWMSGLLAGQIIALILSFALFRKIFNKTEFSEKPNADGIFSKSTLLFCYPVAIATLFMWFMNQGYRLVVERNLGAEALASVGVGLGLAASLAGVIESIATQYLYPKYYAALVKSNIEQRSAAWKSLSSKALVVYIPFCFLTISVANLLVRVLASEIYRDVVPFVIVGALIELFRQLSNITYLVSHGEKKTHFTIFPYFLGAAILASSLVLLSTYSSLSIYSVLISLLAASSATYCYNLLIVRKLISSSVDFKIAGKSVLISTPLLLSGYLLFSSASIPLLVLMSILNGGWCLASVLYLTKES